MGSDSQPLVDFHLTTFLLLVSMEAFFQEKSSLPWTGWAIWHQGRPVKVSDETVLQIKVAPMNTLGWCDEELGRAWKKIFPITPTSIRTGFLPLDHPAWGQTPNPWWIFITDTPVLSWEEMEELNKQRMPSVMPHFDESGWIIRERKLVDFRRMATAHMWNHPMLKLV